MKKDRRKHRKTTAHSSRHDRTAQRARIRELQRALMLPDTAPTPDSDLDALEETLRYLATIDEEPTTTNARQLIADGIELPPPDAFTEETVHAKLWEVIRGLAARRCFLDSTNHLSDLELYRRLWEDTLNQPAYELDDRMGDCACHIDFASSGSEEDTRAYLQFYADDEDRKRWRLDFPEDALPERIPPPYDRDRLLPERGRLAS